MKLNKITLHVADSNNPVEIDPERVFCNDVVLPWENHPHGMKLWIIGDVCGNFGITLGAVWANNEQEAMDILIDGDLGEMLVIDDSDFEKMDEDEMQDVTFLGNAGIPCDLSNTWIYPVVFDPARDYQVLCMFAEARGANYDNLGQL